MAIRKKNNNIQRMRNLSAAALKNICVGYNDNSKKETCEIIDTNQIGFVRPYVTTTNAITNVPYKWCILLAVFGIDSNGKRYFKSEELKLKARHYHKDLNELLIDKHKAMVANFNVNHRTSVGWLASPSIESWELKQADQLFDLMSPY